MNHLFYCGIPIGTFRQDVESTSWVINHDAEFNTVLDVMVHTTDGLQVIFPTNIVATDPITTTVSFISAFAGEARMLGIRVPEGATTQDYIPYVTFIAPVSSSIGYTDNGSNPAPPGEPLSHPSPNGGVLFRLFDNFLSNDGTMIGRAPNVVSPGSLTWNSTNLFANGLAGSVSDGVLHLISNQDSPNITTFETLIDMPSGMYLEFKFTTTLPNESAVLFTFSVGETSIVLTVFGNGVGIPTEMADRIRMEVAGNNGYPGGYPDSYTTDAYYSDAGDYRDQVIRMEVQSNLVKLIVNGITLIEQIPRFTVITQGTDASVAAFATYTNVEYNIDYIDVGSL